MTTPTPGSSKFLSRLLTSPNHSCAHRDKTKSHPIPARLGFTRYRNKILVWIDTSKLCQPCYHAAVPNGFGCGLTTENPLTPIAAPVFSPSSYYPPIWEVGTENYPAANVRNEKMPASLEGQEAFRLLLASGQPFYIDLLHLTRPFNAHAPNVELDVQRVQHETDLALAGASRVLTSAKPGTPEFNALGGRGVPLGAPTQLYSGHLQLQNHRKSQGQNPGLVAP